MHLRSIATPNGPWPKLKISCRNFDKTVDIVTAVSYLKVGIQFEVSDASSPCLQGL